MGLDSFKTINDSFGHGAGDDVLRRVWKIISENSRPRDIAARLGGEEFSLMVDAGSHDELLSLAEHIRAAVGGVAIPTRAGPVELTMSIGGALAGQPKNRSVAYVSAPIARCSKKHGWGKTAWSWQTKIHSA